MKPRSPAPRTKHAGNEVMVASTVGREVRLVDGAGGRGMNYYNDNAIVPQVASAFVRAWGEQGG